MRILQQECYKTAFYYSTHSIREYEYNIDVSWWYYYYEMHLKNSKGPK